jgi:type I phosphodiesterase/nucleotide pyrophosphatase
MMKFPAFCLTVSTLAFGQTLSAQTPGRGSLPPVPPVKDPIVVQFMIDGIDANTVRTAVANAATTVASLLRQGVTVEQYYCTSPAPRLQLPDGSLPWGGSTSSNVAMHTGTHLFESRKMDDIFLSARRAGIVSVFAGGSQNYAVFDNATHLYYGGDELTDQLVVDRGLQHLNKDGARLLRLHLQHIRNAWRGPSDTTNPKSEYIQYFVKTVDPMLAKLIAGLKSAGVWERTYVILGSDHGMGQTSASGHPQSVVSSWQTFMAFYGPGVKRGAKIAYAEGPDVAVMTNYFLGLPPLQGHLDEKVPANLRGVTGVFLANILEGGPADINHPRLIERYLHSGMPRGDEYVDYRAAMIKLLAAQSR